MLNSIVNLTNNPWQIACVWCHKKTLLLYWQHFTIMVIDFLLWYTLFMISQRCFHQIVKTPDWILGVSFGRWINMLVQSFFCVVVSVFYLVNGHKSCLHYQSVGFTGERLEVTLQHGPAFFSQHALQSDFNIYEKVKQERVTRTNTFTQLNHVSRF